MVSGAVEARRSNLPGFLAGGLAAALWLLIAWLLLNDYRGMGGRFTHRPAGLLAMFAVGISAFALDELRQPRRFTLAGGELVVSWFLGRSRSFPVAGLESRFGAVRCEPSGEQFKISALRHSGAEDLHRAIRAAREVI